MSDLIRRKGVFIPDITVEMFRNASLESIEDLMASGEMEDILLPSAQPERIKGHWVEIASSNHTYKCSVCGRLLVNITDGKNNVAKNYPYCHCGANMRGEQDDE